jgi:hypothetical protein
MAKRPVSSTPDPDSAEAARLLVAHGVLDERPSPAVRAAVLRAAAESVGAPATAAARAPRERAARPWFGWRPAAAASATVAVGLLAVGIATHVERETSTATPIESRSEAAPPASPLPSYHAAPTAPLRADAPADKPNAPAQARDEVGEAKPATAAPASANEMKQTLAPGPAARKARQAAASEAPSEEAKDAIAPAPPVEAEKRAVAPQSASGVAARVQPRAMQAPAMEATRRQAIPQAAAQIAGPPSPEQTGALAGKEPLQRPATPDEWLRRIIELRRAGRGAEADEELTRFRAAFPNVKVPDDALR